MFWFFFFWFNSLSRGGLKARCFDEDFRGLLLGGSSYDTLFFFLNVSGQVLRVSFDVNVRSVDVSVRDDCGKEKIFKFTR